MKAKAREDIEDKKMPLLDHLVELRSRLLWSVGALIVAFILSFVFAAKPIYQFLAKPLGDILRQIDPTVEPKMIFTGLTEAFVTDIRVAFFFAAFVTCPVFLTQIWKFVAPGLYRNERRALAPFLVASPILFVVGAALVYYILIPMAWSFFLSFQAPGGETTVGIELAPKIDEYLSLVMTLIFVFGLCFQMPVVMTLLARVGIASAAGMAKTRKYAILVICVVAAIFTPPDPLSMFAFAIPLVVLYEISILAARLIEKRRGAPADTDSEDTEDESAGKDLAKT